MGICKGAKMSELQNTETKIEDFHASTFEPIEAETSQGEPQQPIQETSQETPVKADETPQEPFDAVKHYQSIADKRLAELEREKVARERLEAELNQLKQPKAQEPPKKPIKPKDYDATEAITNPESISWKYREEKEVWDDYRDSKVESLEQMIQQERQASEEIKQQTALKAYRIGQIQKMGVADIKEAEEIWDNFSTPKKDEDFLKDVIEFHRFKRSQINPSAQKRVSEIEQRNERMKQPLPPGVLPGKSDDLPSPDELFNQSLENKKGQYSLK